MKNLAPQLANSQTQPFNGPDIYDQLRAEQEEQAKREIRTLNDVAFCFLHAAGGDIDAAVKLFDDAVDILCESSVLQMHAYRTVLSAIREGL